MLRCSLACARCYMCPFALSILKTWLVASRRSHNLERDMPTRSKAISLQIKSNKMKLITTLTFFLLINSTLHAFQTENWPAWRGPTLNGHAAENAKPPVEWSEDKNVRWKAELPGLGNSTPCVWGNKIILTSAKGTGEKTEGDKPGEVLSLIHI